MAERRELAEARRDDRRRLWKLCKGYVRVALVPRRRDASVMRRWIDRYLEARPWWTGFIEQRMEAVLGPWAGSNIDLGQQARIYCRRQREGVWGHWRALHRGGWRINTAVDGLEYLGSALDAGRGAVLWGLSHGGDLVPKIALHGADVGLVHLSAVDHGAHYPVTKLGARVVGPFHCVAENRYLAERVIIPADGSLGYLRVLLDRLEQNRCVWIAAERQATRGNESAELLGRRVRLATGAPALAWRRGAALLPSHTIRIGQGVYRCHVGPPITARRGGGKQAFVREAVGELAARLQSLVVEYPSDWSWEAHTIDQLLEASE